MASAPTESYKVRRHDFVESRSDLVRRFTFESAPDPSKLPVRPREMTYTEVSFITKMVMSELVELAVAGHGACESKDALIGFLQQRLNDAIQEHLDKPNGRQIPVSSPDPVERIAEQADALVDIVYYVENAAVKAGIDLEPIFNVVHAANESKKFDDGKYHRNAEGKVIKPPAWTPPDVKIEVLLQLRP